MLSTREQPCWPGLTIDRQLFRVAFGSRELDLTTTEYDLLVALYDHRHLVLSRRELHRVVWGGGTSGQRVVDTYVSRLRAKLQAAGHPGVTSIRKRGYRLAEPVC